MPGVKLVGRTVVRGLCVCFSPIVSQLADHEGGLPLEQIEEAPLGLLGWVLLF